MLLLCVFCALGAAIAFAPSSSRLFSTERSANKEATRVFLATKTAEPSPRKRRKAKNIAVKYVTFASLHIESNTVVSLVVSV